MRKRRLSGPRPATTADDRGGRRAVMRRAERRNLDQRMARVEQPRHGVDPRHLESLAFDQRRQDAGEPSREHRLAGARWAREQQIVSTGGRELERPPSTLLAAHVGEVGWRGSCNAVRAALNRLWLELTAQTGDGLGEMEDRYRLDACERRLARRRRRAEDPREPGGARPLRHREYAAHRAQTPVERELADGGVTLELLDRYLTRCREQRKRDRQIEPGALLAQPGGREVDCDPPFRPFAAGRTDPAADTVLGFLARAVRQADDREGGDAAMHLRLHLDAARLETDERMGDRAG